MMQAQVTKANTKAINVTQSLAAVHTMLRAGLGCIAFLRNLLPEENFTENYFTSTEDTAVSLSDASFSSTDSQQKINVNEFKIMAIIRGYSDEADKILNYLEHGIFHALQKQYLRSFIFAIYLDNKDPNNIVEAYTFNFHYHTIPGTDTVVPIMTLGEGLQKMSLKNKNRRADDPVTEAAKKGNAPTLRDVKKSVKNLLKTLIHATTQMDMLPKRRFATFKVFYTDDTPSDYEPPYFQAADADKDKWYFMTHDIDEIPDRWSIGKINTGYHSVSLDITSIATYLPSSTEHDDAAFAGTTSRLPRPPSLTPMQEAALRVQQIEKQSKDADERNVVWSGEDAVELHDIDGEGDDDPDYRRLPDGSYEKIVTHNLSADTSMPVGLRNEAGEIEPLPLPSSIASEEAQFGGVAERIPTRLDELNAYSKVVKSNVEQTQDIEALTQNLCLDPESRQHSDNAIFTSRGEALRKTTSDVSMDSIMSPLSSQLNAKSFEISNKLTMDDTEMIDLETQIEPLMNPESIEPIESFGADTVQGIIELDGITSKPAHSADDIIDKGLNCECGISIEDECCFCEGGCGRWYHLWCMGYHSTRDPRIPHRFICFDCRVRADFSWELMKLDLYPKMLSRFKELALFRRAIKVAETEKPETMAEFTRAIGGDNTLVRQLVRRLETEGFIDEQLTVLDDLGLAEIRSRNLRSGNKAKSKAPKTRKNVQKIKYRFNRSKLSTTEYANYFNPSPDVEGRLLGLSELNTHLKSERNSDKPRSNAQPVPTSGHPEYESQTQDETQLNSAISTSALDDSQKRRNRLDIDETTRPSKKVKISITYGVDLAE